MFSYVSARNSNIFLSFFGMRECCHTTNFEGSFLISKTDREQSILF
ncbi:unnamed protein product [Tenebrio molitor]|nr:unnamed protein product [Tenebrio molitor]